MVLSTKSLEACVHTAHDQTPKFESSDDEIGMIATDAGKPRYGNPKHMASAEAMLAPLIQPCLAAQLRVGMQGTQILRCAIMSQRRFCVPRFLHGSNHRCHLDVARFIHSLPSPRIRWIGHPVAMPPFGGNPVIANGHRQASRACLGTGKDAPPPEPSGWR